MSETFFKPGDRVDILHKGRWISDPAQIVQNDKRTITISGAYGGQLDPEEVRLHIPEPELNAEVRFKGWDPFSQGESVEFCRLIHSFDFQDVRMWTVHLKRCSQRSADFMTAPASEFEVVQE